MRPDRPTPPSISKWRVLIAAVCVLTGAVAMIAAVVIIYWPAAILLAGVLLVAAGIRINVVKPPEESNRG